MRNTTRGTRRNRIIIAAIVAIALIAGAAAIMTARHTTGGAPAQTAAVTDTTGGTVSYHPLQCLTQGGQVRVEGCADMPDATPGDGTDAYGNVTRTTVGGDGTLTTIAGEDSRS